MEPGSWYWHRNLVERDREKRLLCERKGIRLITVYDHYDETAVPFDDCLVTPCDLASRRNMDKLVAVTKTLFGRSGWIRTSPRANGDRSGGGPNWIRGG